MSEYVVRLLTIRRYSIGDKVNAHALKTVLPTRSLADAKELAYVINHANRHVENYAERRATVCLFIRAGSSLGNLYVPIDDIGNVARDFADAHDEFMRDNSQHMLTDTRE